MARSVGNVQPPRFFVGGDIEQLACLSRASWREASRRPVRFIDARPIERNAEEILAQHSRHRHHGAS